MSCHSTPCGRPPLKHPYGLSSGVTACKAGNLRPSYYSLGYPIRPWLREGDSAGNFPYH